MEVNSKFGSTCTLAYAIVQ